MMTEESTPEREKESSEKMIEETAHQSEQSSDTESNKEKPG